MENLLNTLNPDMQQLIFLSGELAKYNEMLLHHSDIEDKRNYDEVKCEQIREKILDLYTKFYNLKEKWF